MAEFTLPANSKIDKAAGKKYPAPAGAKRVRKFVIYRFDPDSGQNPRMSKRKPVPNRRFIQAATSAGM